MDDNSNPRVFLSYARADRARAAKLAEALTVAGLNVWWDTAIETGSQFSDDIERELNAADVVLVLWSATSVRSPWVRDEAGHGRDRARLVPVLLDGTLPPLGFRQFHSTDLSGWKGRAGDPRIAALATAIRKLAGGGSMEPTAAPRKPAATGPSRRALLGGAAGVAVLAAGGFGAWKLLGGKADDGTGSIVVLPFANLSGDPQQRFFSDGVAEELRNALAQIQGLKVIGRVSSEQFRDATDLAAAANKLGVDHVLTGSVRRSPSTLRISAQLVDGKTGVESWSQSYDQPVGDALAVQSKIANSVVAALSAKLGKAAGTLVVGGTTNSDAQALFLKAQDLGKADRSKAGWLEQLSLIDAAIALDPTYAEAWAARGQLQSNLRNYAVTAAEKARLLNDAMTATQRAVTLAPNSGYVRMALALRWRDQLEMRRALAEADRAIALAPADGRVVRDYASLLRVFDPARSIGIARDALEFDPLNPAFTDVVTSTLLAARRYREAEPFARETLTQSSNRQGANGMIATLLGLGKPEAARGVLQYVPFDTLRLTLSAIIEARAGNRPASDAALAALRRLDDGRLNYRFAAIHAERGETGPALKALETALSIRETALYQVSTDSWFDTVRTEPRFKAVQNAVIPPDLFVPATG